MSNAAGIVGGIEAGADIEGVSGPLVVRGRAGTIVGEANPAGRDAAELTEAFAPELSTSMEEEAEEEDSATVLPRRGRV